MGTLHRTRQADTVKRPTDPPERWKAQAACLGVGWQVFYADEDSTGDPPKPEAIRLCKSCPVRARCAALPS